DLFYRLNVVPIVLPPLRDRRSDIPKLVYHFASRAAAEGGKRIESVTLDAMERLQAHDWPGNVRELQHAVERAVVLADGPVLGAAALAGIRTGPDLAERVRRATPPLGLPDIAAHRAAIALRSLNLHAAEAALIAEALRVSNNNRTHAAGLLGIG